MEVEVKVTKCQCGYPNCNYYGVSNGSFDQGNGWDKETAEFVAFCFNDPAVKALWNLTKVWRKANA